MTNHELASMNATSIIEAILAIKKDVLVTVDEDDVDMITWHDDNPTNITREDILAKQVELRVAYDAKVQHVATLETKLADDSITFTELKDLMRFRG